MFSTASGPKAFQRSCLLGTLANEVSFDNCQMQFIVSWKKKIALNVWLWCKIQGEQVQTKLLKIVKISVGASGRIMNFGTCGFMNFGTGLGGAGGGWVVNICDIWP